MTRISDIISVASRLSGFDAADIKSIRRFQAIARVRFAVFYVARQHGHSFPKIGSVIGRDHSTVVHGNSQCINLMGRDPEYAAFVGELVACSLNATPFLSDRRKRAPVVKYEFLQVPPTKPEAPIRMGLPRNIFAAKVGEQDDGHRFQESMKAGSTALLNALLAHTA